MPVAIFLSYSTHDDAPIAGLRTALESYGLSVWADSQRLSAGEVLTQPLQEAIANCQHFVVLLSPLAINSPWVHKQVQLAHAVKRSQHNRYKVIPVPYNGVTPKALPCLFSQEPVAVTLNNHPHTNAVVQSDV